MDEEMENVKRTLRSLVVSSPAIVDVRSLMRDYRQMVGRPVPCDKFGYRDVLSFLKERCSDCFLFQGMPDNPILTLIVPDSLKHIDKFVQRSKTNPKTKCKGKRRSVPESAVRPPTQNLIVSTFSKKSVNTKTESTHNLQSNRKEYYKAETKPKTGDPPKPTNVNIDKTPSYKSVPNLNKVEEERSEVDSTSCSRSALKNFLRKRIPMYNSQNLDGDFNDKDSSHDSGRHTSDSARCTDSARQTLSSASSRRLAQRDQLLDELMQILKESCQDISAADLFRLYRARYNRELEFSHLGYTSIVALVAALGERVQLSRDDEGVRVRVAGAPPSAPPAAPRAPPRPAPTRLPRAPARVQDVPVDAEDALPGIAFDPDVFPSDCLHFLESIPAVSIDDVSPGDNLEVNVAEVYSPSHFWMILRGEEYNLALDEVMDNMNEYYNSEAGQRALLPGAALVGHYCAALYLQDWHRALVVGVPGAATLQIRHIDYGTVDTVAAAALRPLRREFASLPAQAVRGRLAGARPAAGGRHWPRPAAAAFLSAVRDTPLVACVANVCRQESILEVFLIDTSTAVDRDISTELIRADHADPREDSALLVSPAPAGPAPAGPAPRALDPAHPRRVLSVLSHLSADDDAASDVSLSASQVCRPVRLKTWQCEDTSDDDSDVSTSTLSSACLARLNAMHLKLNKGYKRDTGMDNPDGTVDNKDSNVDSKIDSNVYSKLDYSIYNKEDSTKDSSTESGDSMISVSSRLIRRKLEIYSRVKVVKSSTSSSDSTETAVNNNNAVANSAAVDNNNAVNNISVNNNQEKLSSGLALRLSRLSGVKDISINNISSNGAVKNNSAVSNVSYGSSVCGDTTGSDNTDSVVSISSQLLKRKLEIHNRCITDL